MRICYSRLRRQIVVFVHNFSNAAIGFILPSLKKVPRHARLNNAVVNLSVPAPLYALKQARYRYDPIRFLDKTTLRIFLANELNEVRQTEISCAIKTLRKLWVVEKVVFATSAALL